nr:PREDICTED: uncharacterized protein LOC109038705 [Bemisia tabaci]
MECSIPLTCSCAMELDQSSDELIRISSIFNAAIENNDLDTVHKLLKTGLNPNNPFTANCVRHATVKNNLDLVKLLVEYNADVNSNAYIDTALCVAVENGFSSIVEFLVSCGADTQDTNSSGLCFLHTAVQSLKPILHTSKQNRIPSQDHLCSVGKEYKFFRILKCLLEKDSSQINDKCGGKTLLCLLTADLYNARAVLPFIKLLLNHGADVNVPSGRLTPLFYATKLCQDELVKLFLEFGAKVDVRLYNNNKMNILHYAIKKNRFSTVKLIMDCMNLDINSERYYYHALPLLHYTVKKGCPGILRSFLLSGGDITVRDKNGRSILENYMNVRKCRKQSLKMNQCLRLIIFFMVTERHRNKYDFTDSELRSLYSDWCSFRYLDKAFEIGLIGKVNDRLPVTYLHIIYASDSELAMLVRKYSLSSEFSQDIFPKECNMFLDVFEELINKGKKRLEILNKTKALERAGYFLSPIAPLNILCVENIVKFLNNVDLKNLLRASKRRTFYPTI